MAPVLLHWRADVSPEDAGQAAAQNRESQAVGKGLPVVKAKLTGCTGS